ncbi:PAS domain-containing hybrid sensor histidine kinase/response regulator [Desulfuromonas sp. TF]|uniref:PAS domain-containing hybrid sensor histidine kinase/response regulator n=1 Tax=Desulfuromonas sp. TF TaxID=1232410 RepID=UPI0003FF0FD6|nr:PAS domain-containing hybrid sensor histidine kinase/response regulator [Desulfuromonas sp. TF]
MPASDIEQEKIRLEQELRVQRQVAFAAGLFQEDLTVRTLLESLAEGVVVIDSSGTILQVNKSAEKMFGHSREELIGKPHSLLIPERFRQVHKGHQAHYFEEPKVRRMGELLDLTGLRKDGSEFPVEISLTYLDTVNGVIVLALVNDITLRVEYESRLAEGIIDRKFAEEQRRESEEKFRAVFEQAAIGMGRVSFADARWIDVNDAFCRMLGYPPEEMRATPWPQITHPEDVDLDLIPFRRMAAGELNSYTVEKRFIHKQGHHVWARLTLSLVRDAEGRPDYQIAVIENITERKRSEEELKEAISAAEKASRSKSEFLANMSHEIRTPMTVFMAAIEHLMQIDRSPERRHLLGMAEQSAKRLRSLIDDILDFSRIEAQKVDIEAEPFDLRACVDEAIGMFALAAREKNISLKSEVSPAVPDLAIGDPNRLGQVLTNLIGNAVKFTHEGKIRVRVQPRGEFLEFSVADTGIGIPREKRHLLFQSFTQVDSSLTRKFGGTGLGLAISKGLVHLMGGDISVRSREGKGSVFTFTIPLKSAEKQPETTIVAPSKEPGKEIFDARILLAEDDPLIRDVITLMLAQRGWQAVTAETGWDAVEKWESGNFELVLMDLQMPEMNGLEATRTIREREADRNKRACIIGLTAHARREIMEDCLKAGMDRVLTKPVQMSDLYSAIGDCLE